MISSFSAGMVLSVRKSNKILFMFSINGTKVHFKNLLLPFCEVLLISHQILRYMTSLSTSGLDDTSKNYSLKIFKVNTPYSLCYYTSIAFVIISV